MKKIITILILFTPLLVMTKVLDNLADKRIEWVPFSDQVMGGISEVNFMEREENGLSHYHMEGNVSTENNGGFIQFRANVKIEDLPYKGLKIKTRGNGEAYFIHIRTPKTRLPWNYYASSFTASSEWESIKVPVSYTHLTLPTKRIL